MSEMEPGIYLDLHADDYYAAPGLSNSGIGELLISPLHYWHKVLNPAREPEEDTAATRLGTALHCAVLEPEETFEAHYAREILPEDFPGSLVKADDLKSWIRAQGGTPKGTTKAGWIEQIKEFPGDIPPIWDEIERQFYAANAGKTILKADEWHRVAGMTQALKSELPIQKILRSGKPEVSIFALDPETGVLLKGRLDWVAPEYTLDLKTFSLTGDKTIDKTVADAIYWRGYYRQAYYYDLIRRLALKEDHGRADFVMAFVESDAPHETRIKRLLPKVGGEVNMYWEQARIVVRDSIRLYARCMERWGTDQPWRESQGIVDLHDEDMKQLAWN